MAMMSPVKAAIKLEKRLAEVERKIDLLLSIVDNEVNVVEVIETPKELVSESKSKSKKAKV